eukprot:COSAG01_NODE_20720_length_938_cov_2.288439_1_plen_218_part_01
MRIHIRYGWHVDSRAERLQDTAASGTAGNQPSHRTRNAASHRVQRLYSSTLRFGLAAPRSRFPPRAAPCPPSGVTGRTIARVQASQVCLISRRFRRLTLVCRQRAPRDARRRRSISSFWMKAESSSTWPTSTFCWWRCPAVMSFTKSVLPVEHSYVRLVADHHLLVVPHSPRPAHLIRTVILHNYRHCQRRWLHSIRRGLVVLWGTTHIIYPTIRALL